MTAQIPSRREVVAEWRRACEVGVARPDGRIRSGLRYTPVTHAPPTPKSRKKIRASVALALLEAVRDHDLPGEILDDEDVSMTLPRRFGLSDVVDVQIRRYREEAGRGRRIPALEVQDLVRLVARRPDARDVFYAVGRSFAAKNVILPWHRVAPRKLRLAAMRRRVRRRLRDLFGGRFLSGRRGVPGFEAADAFLVDADPQGGACALVTGLAQATVEVYNPAPIRVSHVACKARGDQLCRWDFGKATTRRGVVGLGEDGTRSGEDTVDPAGRMTSDAG